MRYYDFTALLVSIALTGLSVFATVTPFWSKALIVGLPPGKINARYYERKRKLGSTGDPPVPVGDSPTGIEGASVKNLRSY